MRIRKRVALFVAAIAVSAGIAGGSQFIGGGCGASNASACPTPTFPGGGGGGGGGGGSSATTGNLWIVLNGGGATCTRSATPQTLANIPSSAKCATPQAAQNAMQGGDTTMIEAGTYNSTFSVTTGTKGSAVTYQAAGYSPPNDALGVMAETPKVVYTGGILLSLDHIHILGVSAVAAPNASGSGTTNNTNGGVSICGTRANCPAPQNSDILIQGFHGKSFFSNGSGITVDLSEFGGFDGCLNWVVDTGTPQGNGHYGSGGGVEDVFEFWAGAPNATDQMSNDTLKRSVLHDESMGSLFCGSDFASHGPHTDCFQSSGGTNMTIAQNIFYNCPEQNVQWQIFSGQSMSNVTVENNYFGPSMGSSLGLGTAAMGAIGGGNANIDCSTHLIRNNIMYGAVSAAGCTVAGNVVMNNIYLGSGSACDTHSTFSYNVFATAWTTTCGTNVQHCNPTFVNALPGYQPGQAVPNPILSVSDTCARSQGNAGAFPALDLLGVTRPQGTVDIGPTEVG